MNRNLILGVLVVLLFAAAPTWAQGRPLIITPPTELAGPVSDVASGGRVFSVAGARVTLSGNVRINNMYGDLLMPSAIQNGVEVELVQVGGRVTQVIVYPKEAQ